MKKTSRKNKHDVKQTSKKQTSKKQTSKKQTSRKNRKISGGYTEEDRTTWIQVFFNEDEKKQIKDYLEKKKNSTSTEIRDNLFPNISKKAKDNAAYEIQLILGRDYSGR